MANDYIASSLPSDDEFWFTFFHEAGHILLHGKREFFLEHDAISNEKEEQANRFAARTLIPPAKLRKFVAQYSPEHYPSKEAICAFAAEIGIAPALVVRQLQQDKNLPDTHTPVQVLGNAL